MAKQRYIDTRFWHDNFIRENLNPLDRYLFLYFLTNDKTSICGIYELPMSMMASETGLEREMLTKMLKRLKGKIDYYDGWVVIRNFQKYQATANPKILMGIENEMTKIPNWLRDDIGHIPQVVRKAKIIRKKIPTKTRKAVFLRDGKKCQLCLTTEEATLFEVDHIIPVKNGGGNEIENLRILCQSCNGRRNKVGYRSDIGGQSHLNSNSNTNTNLNSNPNTIALRARPLEEEFIPLFESVNPNFQAFFKNKTERAALKWLLEKYGADDLRAKISFLPQLNVMPFAPTITTPFELKAKMGKVLAFLNQTKNKVETNKQKIFR